MDHWPQVFQYSHFERYATGSLLAGGNATNRVIAATAEKKFNNNNNNNKEKGNFVRLVLVT